MAVRNEVKFGAMDGLKEWLGRYKGARGGHYAIINAALAAYKCLPIAEQDRWVGVVHRTDHWDDIAPPTGTPTSDPSGLAGGGHAALESTRPDGGPPGSDTPPPKGHAPPQKSGKPQGGRKKP